MSTSLSDAAVAGGLDCASAMIHTRVDADAVVGNALVSLCNRYCATEGRIPRTNIHRLRQHEVRTTSARDVPNRPTKPAFRTALKSSRRSRALTT